MPVKPFIEKRGKWSLCVPYDEAHNRMTDEDYQSLLTETLGAENLEALGFFCQEAVKKTAEGNYETAVLDLKSWVLAVAAGAVLVDKLPTNDVGYLIAAGGLGIGTWMVGVTSSADMDAWLDQGGKARNMVRDDAASKAASIAKDYLVDLFGKEVAQKYHEWFDLWSQDPQAAVASLN